MLEEPAALPWVAKGRQAPFIFIEFCEGKAIVKGQPDAFLGHRMNLPGDSYPRGHFAHWSWDGSKLTAEVDPLGYFNLFVYSRGNKIGVSPSIFQLIAHGAEPENDQVALAVFHRIGCFVGNDTPFRSIRTLPPGGQLGWENGALQITGGRPPAPKESNLNREQAIEAMIEVPRAGIKRLLAQWQEPITMPLSGGRDSRHILLEMMHQGRRPDTCVTFHHGGGTFNNEAQSARAITTRAGVHHTILGYRRKRLRDSVRALLISQLCADEHRQMMPLHDFFVGRNSASFDGIGGDILTTPDEKTVGLVAMARRGDYTGMAREIATGHSKIISRPGHEGGAGKIYSADLEEAAIDRFATELRQHDDAVNPYQSFWFWNRSRREISLVSTAIMGNARTVLCPYLEPDMVELCMSLPWEVAQDRKLHDTAIQRAYPDYADIPFAEGFSNPIPTSGWKERIENALDAFHVSAMTLPDQPVRAIGNLLRKDGLDRPNSDIYRIYTELVDHMDATKAQRLMRLEERLTSAAPKGEQVVSEAFPEK